MIATTDVAGVSTQLAVLTYLFNPFRLRGRIVWAAREPIMVFGPTTVSGSFFCGHSAFQARPARRTLSPPPGVACLGLVVCKAAKSPCAHPFFLLFGVCDVFFVFLSVVVDILDPGGHRSSRQPNIQVRWKGRAVQAHPGLSTFGFRGDARASEQAPKHFEIELM